LIKTEHISEPVHGTISKPTYFQAIKATGQPT